MNESSNYTKKETLVLNRHQNISFVISESELENIIWTQDQNGLASCSLLPRLSVQKEQLEFYNHRHHHLRARDV